VWPVNPGRSAVGGLRCFPSLRELPSAPDLAILAVPAAALIGAVEDCADAGGGRRRMGRRLRGDRREGRARQAALEAVCRASGIKLCGPNCIGIINTGIGLTARQLDDGRVRPTHAGVVSMVSQSGRHSA